MGEVIVEYICGVKTVSKIHVIKMIRTAAIEGNLGDLKPAKKLGDEIVDPINDLLQSLQGINLNDRVRILNKDSRYFWKFARVSLLGGDTKTWDVGVLLEGHESIGELYFKLDEVKKI